VKILVLSIGLSLGAAAVLADPGGVPNGGVGNGNGNGNEKHLNGAPAPLRVSVFHLPSRSAACYSEPNSWGKGGGERMSTREVGWTSDGIAIEGRGASISNTAKFP